MYATEDGPAPVDPAAGWDAGRRSVVDEADAHAGVVRRLQTRLDRQLRILSRLKGDPLQTEPAELPELLDTARRMRRDSESLLLLMGRDPGVHDDQSRAVIDVLDDAAAAAEEPRRVDVHTAPAAAVRAGAATELLHAVAELLDHTTAVYPGARVEVTSRLHGASGIAVAVRADGATRYDPDGLGGQRAFDAAERLSHRSRHGLALHRELGADGLVATVTLPASAVVLHEPRPAPPRAAAQPNGTGHNGNGPDTDGLGTNGLGTNGFGSNGHNGNGLGSNGNNTNGLGGNGHPAIADLPSRPLVPAFAAGPAPAFDLRPTAPPPEPRPEPTFAMGSSSALVDELFGPIADIPQDPHDEPASTPIFEAIASAWFRGGESGRAPANGAVAAAPQDWETPSDLEWRAAAQRATRAEESPLTANGLPQRRPGNQLVPPPRSRSDARPERPAEQRVPDRVRDRLSGYQRGLQQGRHRAEQAPARAEPADPEFW